MSARMRSEAKRSDRRPFEVRPPRLAQRMSSRNWLLLAALFAAAPAFAQKSEEEAGDVSEADKDASGPLRDRVRPVSGHIFRQGGRFEAGVGLGISTTDAFFTKYTPGIVLTYHFNEDFAVSLRGGYGFNVVSGAAQICRTAEQASRQGRRAGCEPPSADELSAKNAFGQTSLQAGLELQWSPIYGKVGLFAEQFLTFNMYLALGPTLLMYGRENNITVGGNIGIGFRIALNRFMAARLEVRDLLYQESHTVPTQVSSFRNQLMGEFGLSFFLPLDFDRE